MLQFTNCVTMAKLPNVSVLQFHHLYNEDKNACCIRKHLEQFLEYITCQLLSLQTCAWQREGLSRCLPKGLLPNCFQAGQYLANGSQTHSYPCRSGLSVITLLIETLIKILISSYTLRPLGGSHAS